MVTDTPKSKALLPIRHRQQELFICDVADAVLKNDMASMEHPVFSLSTKPDLNERIYEHGDVRLVVTPSVKGMATIYDKDILIFAISQLIAARNAGEHVRQEVSLSARSFLVFANRHTGGSDYNQLEAALDRLTGTRLRTTIETGGQRQDTWFGLVESASVVRVGGSGRIRELRIKLSDWLFNAINSHEVLTMHPDYFRLRKPMERRIYEIARKHCGQQREWKIGIALLHKKTGSRSPLKQFRYLLKDLAERDHLPDYFLSLYPDSDSVLFQKRNTTVVGDRR